MILNTFWGKIIILLIILSILGWFIYCYLEQNGGISISMPTPTSSIQPISSTQSQSNPLAYDKEVKYVIDPEIEAYNRMIRNKNKRIRLVNRYIEERNRYFN